jgi:hypothetical protein
MADIKLTLVVACALVDADKRVLIAQPAEAIDSSLFRPAERGTSPPAQLAMRASATAFWNSAFIAAEMPWVGLTSK